MFTNQTKDIVSYEEIEETIEILQNGGLILYPTDTLWGIGCDATDPVAIERIFNLRGRRSAEDLEMLVDSIDMLRQYIDHLHPKLETLLLYHVRPLTILFENACNLPAALMAPGRRLAARLVQDDFCRTLIAAYDRPLIAAPACVSGQIPPVNFAGIAPAISTGVDHVVRYRQQEKDPGAPSVMVKLSRRDELVFLRE